MAITRAQVTGLDNVAAWLTANFVPSFFKSVTVSDDVLTAIDADNNPIFVVDNSQKKFLAYRGENNAIEMTNNGYAIIGSRVVDLIGCANGFILDHATQTGSKTFALLCAKTNNGKVAVIFNIANNGSSAYGSGVKHVALGDSESISTTTTFTSESGQQTSFATWCTNADAGVASYTPNAYFMPMGQVYSNGIGKFIIGTDTYITNGYWAIKDGGST